MIDWNTDGHGNIRASTVVGWNTAIDETGELFLRIEFSADPDLENVSALQFRLTAQQAMQIAERLTNTYRQSSTARERTDQSLLLASQGRPAP
ncbi:hypothetical protein [Ensifer adhaerens]|uniref:hypothetical protein n=1 Tax=Ensifer adhaerens TaxID=106592 RepID=UPI001C4DDB14|nr:hypothetical protein [Ensifer adhaerens]MBW0367792.1 hypothetical protein [Ensifer adhaerens]UCM24599.1 hypothetical protein LDL63_33415 [Ensifer adhaerens]